MQFQINEETKFVCGRCGCEINATYDFKRKSVVISTCWGCIKECTPPISMEPATLSGEAPVQQLKAEISEVRKYIENMRSSKMSAESILNHVDGTLRQLSAV